MKNILENLELRLAQTKLENSEKLDIIETEFKEEYSDFFGELFKNDNLGIKRYISVSFQLKKLDNPNISNKENLKNSLNKIIDIIPLNLEKREILKKKLLSLEEKKEKISDIFIKNIDLHKNHNFPILESLEKLGFIDNNDLLKISLKFKETNNFLDSIVVLNNYKKELVTKHYYELNNTKKEEKIDNFKNDFNEEINSSKNIQIYPKILKFIGKNYFRLKLKNRVESKKDILKRIFKIAFLKFYRLKYSGIDITSVLNKIDNLNDLDSMVNLLLKFFEQLKQNPNLQKDYIISDEIDEVKEIGVEAEENKEKILSSEENTIKANRLLEEGEKFILGGELDELLDENVDLVGDNFIKRKTKINSGILYNKNENIEEELEYEDKEIDLEEYYEKLKEEFEEVEKKKNKLFLDGNYDILDDINNELLELIVKLEKVSKLLGLEE